MEALILKELEKPEFEFERSRFEKNGPFHIIRNPLKGMSLLISFINCPIEIMKFSIATLVQDGKLLFIKKKVEKFDLSKGMASNSHSYFSRFRYKEQK